MFQYMRHACGVRWIRLESNAEYIVLVISCYVQIVCASLVVLEVKGRQLQFRHVFCFLKSKATDAIAGLG